jgi:FkbM family methyltransferase
MRIIWNIRHSLSRMLYAIAERLPSAWTRKITILLCALRRDWRAIRLLSDFSGELESVSAAEIDRHFQGLDENSLFLLKRYIGKSHFIPWFHWVTAQTPRHYHVWAGLCTEEEFSRGKRQEEEELPALRRKYHLPGTMGDASSLIHHHGLKSISSELKAYLRGKVFIDAGAYVGDSSLAFMEYSPATIYAFEPSRSNRDIFSKLMAENQIQDDRIVLVNKGLADHKGVTTFSENTSGTSLREAGSCRVELITLDDFVKENKLPPVGLIKADVEGMGLALLKGALETIKRDKPVLSLCIYHNKEEFLGTYDLLRNQNLPYDYKVVSLCMPWENNELVLLGLPRL